MLSVEHPQTFDSGQQRKFMTTLDPERQQQAKQYARISRRLWLVSNSLSAIYALAWLFFGWAISLRDWLVGISPNPWFLVAGFLVIFGGIYAVVTLPLDYYSGFVLPHRFDQSNQTLKDWIIDQLKGLAIGARTALSSPARHRRSMVAVGRGRDVGFQRAALEPGPRTHHADFQQIRTVR